MSDPLTNVPRETILRFAEVLNVDCATWTNQELKSWIAENASKEQLRPTCQLDIDILRTDVQSRVSTAEDSNSTINKRIDSVEKGVQFAKEATENATKHLNWVSVLIGIMSTLLGMIAVVGAVSGLYIFRDSRNLLDTLKNHVTQAETDSKKAEESAVKLEEKTTAITKLSNTANTIVMRRLTEDARSEFPNIFADRISDEQVARFTEINGFIGSASPSPLTKQSADSDADILKDCFKLLIKYGKSQEPNQFYLRSLAVEFEKLRGTIKSRTKKHEDSYTARFFDQELPAYIANIAGAIHLRAYKMSKRRSDEKFLDDAERNFNVAMSDNKDFANPYSNRAVVNKYRVLLQVPEGASKSTDDEWKTLSSELNRCTDESLELLKKSLKYTQSDLLRSVRYNNMADWSLTRGMIQIKANQAMKVGNIGGASIEDSYRTAIGYINKANALRERETTLLITEAELECMAIAFNISPTSKPDRAKRVIDLIEDAVEREPTAFPADRLSLERILTDEGEWWHYAIKSVDNPEHYKSQLLKAMQVR